MLLYKIEQCDYIERLNHFDRKDLLKNEKLENLSWHGKGAELLGINVDEKFNREDFGSVFFGIYKDIELRKDSRTYALELVFTVSDLISYVAIALEEEKVEEAFNKATEKALDFVESLVQERILSDDKEIIKKYTNNLLAVKVKQHFNSDKKEMLHTHCVIMNTTKGEDGKWKELSFDLIIRKSNLIKEVFNSELAKNLKNSGYETTVDEKGNVEILGYDKYKNLMQTKEEKIQIIKNRIENYGKDSVSVTVTHDRVRGGGTVSLNTQIKADIASNSEMDSIVKCFKSLENSILEIPYSMVAKNRIKSNLQMISTEFFNNVDLNNLKRNKEIVSEMEMILVSAKEIYSKELIEESNRALDNIKSIFKTIKEGV